MAVRLRHGAGRPGHWPGRCTPIQTQTRQVFDNIKAVLEAAGATMDDLVKVTIHLQNAGDWPMMNEVYGTYFADYLPARMAFEGKPPLDYLVDVDAIAYLPVV